MHARSSFREALARQGATPAERPAPSGSPANYVLSARDVPRPVDAIRLIASFGLSLRGARDLFERLFTGGDGVAVELIVAAGRDPVADLAALGVTARPLPRPAVEVAAIRRGLGLTQAAFAARFGLDPDAVRAWEEGRDRPDAAAAVLLRVIAVNPGAVDAALSG